MNSNIPSSDKILPSCRVLPVVVIKDISEVEELMSALSEGGVDAAEITFRTSCAAEAIKIASEKFPNMKIGAGTVINREQAEAAAESGARFIVSPGFSDAVADVCGERGIPYIPGCVTPAEIMHAIERGITTVKFFPADIYGGLAAVRALSAPFPQIRFLPTGGVGFDNLREFLACDKIAAVGGSFLCKGDVAANCRRLAGILGEKD